MMTAINGTAMIIPTNPHNPPNSRIENRTASIKNTVTNSSWFWSGKEL